MISDHTTRPLSELLSLQGRAAVVTGGAQGIGAATARRLAEAGADVVLADLDLPRARETAEALTAAFPSSRVSAAHADVDARGALADVADQAVDTLGRLDIWVNNAGIFPMTGPAVQTSDETFERILRVNVQGSFAGAREAARRMARGGVIVNLASVASFLPTPGFGAYAVSKHAVIGLTRNLAAELGPADIRVVAVAPGPIDTPGMRAELTPMLEAGADLRAAMSPGMLGRSGVADDVARVITVLASDLAAWVTGDVVMVDGGLLLQ